MARRPTASAVVLSSTEQGLCEINDMEESGAKQMQTVGGVRSIDGALRGLQNIAGTFV